ncbi:hypothetical protein B0H14DRAFT_3427345 [Mycena olivaceomarginata]|nr:hypothetical protein B0H14DRAFT_3427345 [Mycena olivaceomarginata]
MESDRKYCHCKPTCGKLITHRTRRDHYTKVPPESIRRSVSPGQSDLQNLLSKNHTHISPSEVIEQRSPSPSHSHSYSPAPPDLDMCSLEHISSDSEDDLDPWSAFDEFQDLDQLVSREEMLQQLEEMLGPGDEYDDDMPLDAETEASLWDERNNILMDQDRDDIRAFHLKLISKMPRTAYNQMVFAFSHKMDLSSEWVMFHRMAVLCGVEPLWFDCCIDSPRYSPSGKARRMFCYLPIIPRLQGFFQNPNSIQQLLYHANYVHIDGEISDVFDCEHYRSLRDQNVVLDGNVLDHKYFSGKYDVALGKNPVYDVVHKYM